MAYSACIFAAGPRVVDLDQRTVSGPDRTVHLTEMEAKLLTYLAHRMGVAVSREELHREVWGHHAKVVSRTLDTTVRRLRRKLEADPGCPEHLLTEHRRGYRLVLDRRPSAQEVADRVAALVGRVEPSASFAVPAAWLDQVAVLAAGCRELLTLGRHHDAAHACVALLRTIRITGPRSNFEALADDVLRASTSPMERALVHLAMRPLIEPADGARHAAAAVAAAKELGDPLLHCVVELEVGRSEWDALRVERAVELAKELGRPALMVRAIGVLATILITSEPERSRELFLDAIEVAQDGEQGWEEAILVLNFGGLLRQLGDYAAAEPYYRLALARLQSFGDVRNQVVALTALASTRHRLLDFTEAETLYLRAMQVAESIGLELFVAINELSLFGLHYELDKPLVPAKIEAALRVVRGRGPAVAVAVAQANLGLAWFQRGQLGLARSYLERAVRRVEALHLPLQAAEMWRELATLDWHEGHEQRAWDRLQRGIEVLQQGGARSVLARHLLLQEQWARQTGRPWDHDDLIRELAAELPAVDTPPFDGLHRWRTDPDVSPMGTGGPPRA